VASSAVAASAEGSDLKKPKYIESKNVVPGIRIELMTYRLPSHFGFRRPKVRGLDYPFTIAPEP